MPVSSNFPKIFTFAVIIIALALAATILPSSDGKELRILEVEYKAKAKPTLDNLKRGDIFDFLLFRIQPIRVEPRGKIVRSRQPSNKKIILAEKPKAESVRVPISAEFLIAKEKSFIEIFQKLADFVAKNHEIRYQAVIDGDNEKCDSIDDFRAADDCHGEIYFQQAIQAKDVDLCKEIKNQELMNRCEKYVRLIPIDAPQN
jgi:hypothetical protein